VKKIPIARAKEICKSVQADGVLILGIDRESPQYCLTTYGQDKSKCSQMAAIAEQIHEYIQNGELSIHVETCTTDKPTEGRVHRQFKPREER
jgi:hypothetical protein